MLKLIAVGIVGVVGTLLYVPAAAAQSPEKRLSPQPLAQNLIPGRTTPAISPLELQQFVQALRQLQKVQMETQEKMAAALKAEKLSPERFQEIGRQRNNPDSTSTEISPAEQKRFETALEKIQTIQREAVPKQSRAIRLQGLSVERFNQIGQAIEQNPALRQQLQNSL